MSFMYRLKVRAFKVARLNHAWRSWRAHRGPAPGNYNRLYALIRDAAPGKTFADIGCMWGVNGAHSFAAEESGAAHVYGIDVFGPTPEFLEARSQRRSRVEFVLGDCTSPATLAHVGV